MKKGLIIKLAIVLIVLVLSYCVFWFFKAGQSEKQINKFIADNSAHISAGEVSVSGFPVAQRISISDLKIVISTPVSSSLLNNACKSSSITELALTLPFVIAPAIR